MLRINVYLEYVRAKIVYTSLFHKSRSRVHVSSDETTQHVYPNCVIMSTSVKLSIKKTNGLHGLLYIIFNSSVYYLAVEHNEWKRENKK